MSESSFTEELLVKMAEGKRKAGWLEKQKAVSRSMRSKDEGLEKYIANRELIGDRVIRGLKGALIGAVPGAAVGGAVGSVEKAAVPGAILGALLGGLVGHTAGTYSADKKYLRDRGIESRLLGLGTPEFTPEARKRYISERYEGGGYVSPKDRKKREAEKTASGLTSLFCAGLEDIIAD